MSGFGPNFMAPDETPWGLACIDTTTTGLVLRLVGEIDHGVVEAFERSHGGPRSVDYIDARGVTFFSAAAVGLLVRTLNASRDAGKTPPLANSAIVDLVLACLGLQDSFARVGPTTTAQLPRRR